MGRKEELARIKGLVDARIFGKVLALAKDDDLEFLTDPDGIKSFLDAKAPAAAPPVLDLKMQNALLIVAKEARRTRARMMDPWTSSKRSRSEQMTFKERLVEFYQCSDTARPGKLLCQVLNRFYDRALVKASHIWKHATGGDGLEEFGLQTSDLQSPRNGLLLSTGIEERFDTKQLCFLYHALKSKFFVLVVNPDIMDQYVSPSTSVKFEDIHLNEDFLLALPKGVFPFRRLLAWHAELTIEKAPASYGYQPSKEDREGVSLMRTLSDGACFPNTDDDDE